MINIDKIHNKTELKQTFDLKIFFNYFNYIKKTKGFYCLANVFDHYWPQEFFINDLNRLEQLHKSRFIIKILKSKLKEVITDNNIIDFYKFQAYAYSYNKAKLIEIECHSSDFEILYEDSLRAIYGANKKHDDFDIITFINKYKDTIDFTFSNDEDEAFNTILSFIDENWPFQFFADTFYGFYDRANVIFFQMLKKLSNLIYPENIYIIIHIKSCLTAINQNLLNNSIYSFKDLQYLPIKEAFFFNFNNNYYLLKNHYEDYIRYEYNKIISNKYIKKLELFKLNELRLFKLNKKSPKIFYVSEQGIIETFLKSNYSYNFFPILKGVPQNTKKYVRENIINDIIKNKQLSDIFNSFWEKKPKKNKIQKNLEENEIHEDLEENEIQKDPEENEIQKDPEENEIQEDPEEIQKRIDQQRLHFYRGCSNLIDFHIQLLSKKVRTNYDKYEFAKDILLAPLKDIGKLKLRVENIPETESFVKEQITILLSKWDEILLPDISNTKYNTRISEEFFRMGKEFYDFFKITFNYCSKRKGSSITLNVNILIFYALIYPVIKRLRRALCFEIFYNYLINTNMEIFWPEFHKVNYYASPLYFISKRLHTQICIEDEFFRNELINSFIHIYYLVPYNERIFLIYFIAFLKVYYKLFNRGYLFLRQSLILTRSYLKYKPNILEDTNIILKRNLPQHLLENLNISSYCYYRPKKKFPFHFHIQEFNNIYFGSDLIREWEDKFIINEMSFIKSELFAPQPQEKQEEAFNYPDPLSEKAKKFQEDNEKTALKNFNRYLTRLKSNYPLKPKAVENWMLKMSFEYPNSHLHLKKLMKETLLTCDFITFLKYAKKEDPYLSFQNLGSYIEDIISLLHTQVPSDFWSKNKSECAQSKIYTIFNNLINHNIQPSVLKNMLFMGIFIYDMTYITHHSYRLKNNEKFKKEICRMFLELIAYEDNPYPSFQHLNPLIKSIQEYLKSKSSKDSTL